MIAVLIGNVIGAAFIAGFMTLWMGWFEDQGGFVRFIANISLILFVFAWKAGRRG